MAREGVPKLASRLVDIGRNVVEKEVGRSLRAGVLRSALKTVITNQFSVF